MRAGISWLSSLRPVRVEGSGWRGERLAERSRAAALHLLLSALAVLPVAGVAVATWYPPPFFGASGGMRLAVTICVVDVVLGPLLTLLIFDRRKGRSLKIDLALVASLQVGALGYGLHAAALGRPVFQVFVVDRFEIVTAAQADPAELAAAQPEFRRLSWSGPRPAAALLPEDPAERRRLMFASIEGRIDLRHLVSRYVRYERVAADAVARARPVEALRTFNPPAAVDAAVASTRRPIDRLRYLPVQGGHGDLAALIDAVDGSIAGVVPLQPWH